MARPTGDFQSFQRAGSECRYCSNDQSNIWLAFKRDVLLDHKVRAAKCLIQRETVGQRVVTHPASLPLHEVVGASRPQVGPVEPPARPDGGMSGCPLTGISACRGLLRRFTLGRPT
jgi:hypothetical protein